jgi:hypothetical protein
VTDTSEETTRDILAAELAKSRRELAGLEVVLERDGYTVTGARGQTQAHPVLAQIRGHRKTIAELLRALDGPESVSDIAKRAAKARWDRVRQSPASAGQRRTFVPRDSNGKT